MKTLIPALLFTATIPALCQTTPQRPPNPNQANPNLILQLTRQFALVPRDSAKTRLFAFNGNLNDVSTSQVVVPLRTLEFANPHLDEQIIHRPPQGAFAQQQPRTPLAGNLYPGLKLLPTETARLEPIPVYFPKFKVEPIPTTWPNAKEIPVQAATLSIFPKK